MSLETFVMIVSDLDVLRGLEVMVRPSLRFLRGFWGSFTNDVHSHVNLVYTYLTLTNNSDTYAM